MYLASTVISYLLFAYKNSLISAFQRNDVLSNINTVVQSIVYLVQLLIIILTKNYYFYALVLIVGTIINNILTEIVSRRLFPEVVCKGNLNKEIKKEIIFIKKG